MKRQDRELFEDWLGSLDDAFIQCRDVSHSWGRSNVVWAMSYGHHGRILVCAVCGARKEQILTPEHRVIVSRMDYPTDYVKSPDVPKGRVPLTMVRAVNTKNVSATTTPEKLTDIMKRIVQSKTS